MDWNSHAGYFAVCSSCQWYINMISRYSVPNNPQSYMSGHHDTPLIFGYPNHYTFPSYCFFLRTTQLRLHHYFTSLCLMWDLPFSRLYSRITYTKSPSFCMITFSASLTKLTALLPQSHDCNCYESTGILTPPQDWLQRRIVLLALCRKLSTARPRAVPSRTNRVLVILLHYGLLEILRYCNQIKSVKLSRAMNIRKSKFRVLL